jgi:hypothetical protein
MIFLIFSKIVISVHFNFGQDSVHLMIFFIDPDFFEQMQILLRVCTCSLLRSGSVLVKLM